MRPSLDSTQLIPRPIWANPRIALLDDIWLLTIVAVLLATAVPWFVSGFEVEIGTATWGLFALGGIHVAFTLLASPARLIGRSRDRALTLLNLAGVGLLGFIWEHVGALQNPMFLIVFALPVFGAIFLSRWHPYLVAAVSVIVVGIVSLSQAPELRWYASGLFGGGWVTSLFGNGAAARPFFAGFYTPSNYLIVLLEVFTISLFACAVAAEYAGTIFERLNAHIVTARVEAERLQRLWVGLIERLPLPTLLVDPDTLRVAAASDSASTYLHAEEMPLEGRNVFEVIRFSYPDLVHDLIAGTGGATSSTVVRIADQLRVTRVRVLHVAHDNRRLALLTIEDATETFYLKSALDTSEYASLIVDARGIILAFNKPAGGLFGGVEIGADAAHLLVQPEGTLRWWEPGLTGRRKMHIQIGPRIYQITISAIALAGEEERIFTVALLPVATANLTDAFGSGTTITTNTLGRLR